MFSTRHSKNTLTSCALLLAAACSDDDKDLAHDADHAHDAAVSDAGGGSDAGKTQHVEISFEARVGSQAFDCGKTFEVGSPPTMVKPLDFKLYVQDVKLVSASGAETEVKLDQDGVWQNGQVALLDFENDSGTCSNGTSQVHTKIMGSVPSGTYKGLSFRIGVPEAQNHKNQATAASPLNVEGMFWSWLTGYKFLRIDVMPMNAMMAQDADAGPGHSGGAQGFLVHLGSTMCSGDPMGSAGVTCQRENRPKASFDSFDAGKQKVVVDLAKLLAKSDVSMNAGGEPGCMSGPMDPDCPNVFEQLGLELDTGKATGTPAFLSVASK